MTNVPESNPSTPDAEWSERTARVAAAVEAHMAQTAAEDAVEGAGEHVQAAMRERSLASAALRAHVKAATRDPELATVAARYHAACARLDAARAALAMAEASRARERALTEAQAWGDEVTTAEQGNPYAPHTPQNKVWSQGYEDATEGRSSLYLSREIAQTMFRDRAGCYRDGYEAAAQQRSTGAAAAAPVERQEGDWQVETLKRRVQAILGPDFSVAANPHSDFPSVEINAGNGALEYVGFQPEPGRYYATQWTESGPYGGYTADAEFDTLNEAVQHAREGTTRQG